MALRQPRPEELLWAGLVMGVALLGSFVIAQLSYRLSPLLAPVLLALAALVLVTYRRPSVGVGAALLMVPLEVASLPLPSGAVSPSEGTLVLVALCWIARLIAAPSTIVKPGLRDLSVFALLVAYAAGMALATDTAPVLRITILWSLFYLAYLQAQAFTLLEIRNVLIAFVVGAGILGGIGAVSYLQSGQTALFEGGLLTSTRAVGTFADPNYYASMLALGIVPALPIVLLEPKRLWWVAVPSLVATAGLVFSLSRGGFLALASGVLVLLVWRRARRIGAGIVVGLLVLALVNPSPVLNSSQFTTVQQRLSTIAGSGVRQTNLRPLIWATAVDITIEHPLFGVGLREFRAEATRRILFEGDLGIENVHNVPLNIAAENGLVGLVGFMTFVVQLLTRGRNGLRSQDVLAYALALGILASIVGFLVQGLTQMQLRVNIIAATFFVLAGMLTGLSDRVGRAR